MQTVHTSGKCLLVVCPGNQKVQAYKCQPLWKHCFVDKTQTVLVIKLNDFTPEEFIDPLMMVFAKRLESKGLNFRSMEYKRDGVSIGCSDDVVATRTCLN